MSVEDELAAAAVQSWRMSPVTGLVVGWLLPHVGALMLELHCADTDVRLRPPTAYGTP